MPEFLMPISLLVKHYIPVGNWYLSKIPFYLFIVLVFFHMIRRDKIHLNYLISTKVCLYLFFFLGLQFVAIAISYLKIDSNNPFAINPISKYGALLFFVCFLFAHYIILKIMIQNKKDINSFLKGAYIATVIVLISTYLQFLYLSFPSSFFRNVMSFFGNFFEERNPYTEEWYAYGSYVQTIGRINGFYSESAMLAAHLSIICLPFILSSIKNKHNIFSVYKKYNPFESYLLLFLILVMLFLAKTTTGILAILIVMFLFWIALPIKRKVWTGFSILILCVVVFYLYNNTLYFRLILDQYVFDKTGSESGENRLGNTIALLTTILHNPVLGVGHHAVEYYLLQYTPTWTTDNYEFDNFVNVRRNIPILSIFFGWIAQYGILVFLFFTIYIVRLLKSLSILVSKFSNSEDYKFYKTLTDSASFFFLIFLPLSFFNFGWNEPSFLVMFFFFVVFRHHLRKTAESMGLI